MGSCPLNRKRNQEKKLIGTLSINLIKVTAVKPDVKISQGLTELERVAAVILLRAASSPASLAVAMTSVKLTEAGGRPDSARLASMARHTSSRNSLVRSSTTPIVTYVRN